MTLKQFFKFFPKVALPLTLNDEILLDFSRKNKPLTPEAIQTFIAPNEKEIDELTEFIPCFKLPDTELFNAIVYWKGGVLNYEYVLISYDLRGNFICRRSLATMFMDGDNIKKSIAQIHENGTINIVAGQNHKDENQYDPKHSKVYRLEIKQDGQVVFTDES